MGFPQYGFKHQAPQRSVLSLPTSAVGLVRSRRPPPRGGWLNPSRSPQPKGASATTCGALAYNDPTWAQALAPTGLCWPALNAYWPHPPVWSSPAHFPAELVIRPVFGIPGPSCLSSRPSGLSLSNCTRSPPSTSAGSPVRACPHSFRTDVGHRLEGRKSWHSNTPLESVSCGTLFRRFVRSLWLRLSCLFAPWTDPTETVRCPPGRLGLLHPGFQPPTTGDCRV